MSPGLSLWVRVTWMINSFCITNLGDSRHYGKYPAEEQIVTSVTVALSAFPVNLSVLKQQNIHVQHGTGPVSANLRNVRCNRKLRVLISAPEFNLLCLACHTASGKPTVPRERASVKEANTTEESPSQIPARGSGTPRFWAHTLRTTALMHPVSYFRRDS